MDIKLCKKCGKNDVAFIHGHKSQLCLQCKSYTPTGRIYYRVFKCKYCLRSIKGFYNKGKSVCNKCSAIAGRISLINSRNKDENDMVNNDSDNVDSNNNPAGPPVRLCTRCGKNEVYRDRYTQYVRYGLCRDCRTKKRYDPIVSTRLALGRNVVLCRKNISPTCKGYIILGLSGMSATRRRTTCFDCKEERKRLDAVHRYARRRKAERQAISKAV